MAMRIEVDFDQPLTKEQRTGFLLALAVLLKQRACAWWRGDCAVVMGEALGLDRIRSALQEEGVPAACTSLHEEEDLRADDVSDDHPSGKERLRPIGR